MRWQAALALPIFLSAVWFHALSTIKPLPSTLQNKTILLLIAHPDDEAMFFSPTLLTLTSPVYGNKLKLLCLSTGNADGLGDVRSKELIASGLQLGISSAEDITIIDDSAVLPDSMTASWPSSTIASYITTHAAGVDVIITFDEYGVSQHPNHISLLRGAQQYISGLKTFVEDAGKITALYTLRTVGILHKYLFVFDALSGIFSSPSLRGEDEVEEKVMFVCTPAQVRTGQLAMATAHKSQMRWFRWGWIGLSRYMVINDLNLVRL